jgi:predicted Rossmann-fold nucleotide-binding protein
VVEHRTMRICRTWTILGSIAVQRGRMSEPTPKTMGTGIVRLSDEEGVRRIVVDTVFGLWTMVDNLTRLRPTRLRPTRRERFRVTIFGSARIQPEHFVYDEVKRLSSALTETGGDIVTGGGPGLMQAANEGAQQAGDGGRSQSVGIRVERPFEQEVNPFVQEAFEHQTFFSRLHHFVLLSDADVVVAGGIGTVLEATLVWQLLRVRHLHDTPLIFVGEMWEGLVDWARRSMLRPGFELANPTTWIFRIVFEPPRRRSRSCTNGTVDARPVPLEPPDGSIRVRTLHGQPRPSHWTSLSRRCRLGRWTREVHPGLSPATALGAVPNEPARLRRRDAPQAERRLDHAPRMQVLLSVHGRPPFISSDLRIR